MQNSTSESGIFNSSSMNKIKRKCKTSLFNQKLSRNLTKYLFDFFYYRELYQICSANLFLYQCFTEYQLMTWKLEMNNIIDIFHLSIKNYDEDVDDTLTECIRNKRTYKMIDHPGCSLRINKEGINIFSEAYLDSSFQQNLSNNCSPVKNNYNNLYINSEDSNSNSNNNLTTVFDNNNNFYKKIRKNTIDSTSEPPSNFGSMESVTSYNKNNDSSDWTIKHLEGSYNNNKCILLTKTTPLNIGFSFYHIIKGDYQLYLHHSLINMKNARLILQVSINGVIVYTLKDFPSNELIEQDTRDEKEKEKNIKLREYLICSITKKMFEQSFSDEKEDDENKNNANDYEVRVTFRNQDLFWKAGWCIDGGRLLRKTYEVNDKNSTSFKRFKSENNINIFGSINKYDVDENQTNNLRKSLVKMNSLDVKANK